MEFLQEDLLPPKFGQDFYYSYLESPQFAQATELKEVFPDAISAQDGDIELNETVVFSLDFPKKECEASFEIDSKSGIVTWKAPIDKNCQESDIIIISVKACQENLIDKCAATTLTIGILGNEYQPSFTSNLYEADLIKLTVCILLYNHQIIVSNCKYLSTRGNTISAFCRLEL